ncbi:MAG: S8 family serine peptidase [Oscillospiraceae bacterium]|nr:S8 family serine peptidase [Oscillospiraceae bacterium]
MKHSLKRFVSWMLAVCMVLSFVPAAGAAQVIWNETDLKITAENADRLVQKDGAAEREASEMVRVSIVLEKPSTVEAGYATMGIAANPEAMDYRAQLLATQKRMEKTISNRALNGRPLDVVWNMTLVGNIISAWVPYGSLEKIAAIDGVKTVAMEAQYSPAVAERNEELVPNAYTSSAMIGSGNLWSSGYTGAGTRIAIVDTGTDTDHQSFDNGAYLHALAENAKAKGMSLESYMASLDLLDADDIAAVLDKLHAAQRMPGITAKQLSGTEKLPYGFNYVDSTLNIVHDYDQQGEHGSHVAGISAANRFIPNGSGYAEASGSVMMQGVAPDAQILTMKVFGDGSPFDSDYMAAIEDAIILGCDTVNLSLGTTMPGSPYTDVFSDLMEMMKKTDTVVVISAGNASNWAAASLFGYLYNDDVSFDTVGAPGSYASAFTVASVQNEGSVGFFLEANGQKAFYVETLGYGNTPLSNLDKSLDLDGTEYEYIFLDGIGEESEYAGIDVNGKVVFVQRGTLNFAVKANNALSRGAVGVVVYNNQDGISNMDLTGLNYAAPVVSITQAEGAAIRAASQNKGSYLTGKITIYGKMGATLSNAEYYTMSGFSSWGTPGALTLKPEITAPGGEIYSVWGSNAITGGGSDKYVTMSGTSMAAPQVAGMGALLAQAFRENGMGEKSGISDRHLAQSLLMSTAQPLFEENSGGNYYSLLNQGAGLARVDLAAQADSYIKVDGQDDYKVKAELGDDPARTGVYEFDFSITNITDSEKVYALDADLFRQDVFEYQEGSGVWLLDTWTVPMEGNVTFSSAAMGGSSESCDLNGDGITNSADADYLLEYLVGNETVLHADGDVSGDGKTDSYDAHLLLASLTGDTVTVPAGDTVSVHVRMALTAEEKAELDELTPKGTYVEAFVYARGVADAEGKSGTVHSIPVLGFYGDWSEPSMFDRGTLVEHIHLAVNTAPYLYRFIGPYGNALGIDYGDGMEYYYGGNPILDDAAYLPERNAFNSLDASQLTEQGFTLIRGAGAARIQITNAETGEVYFSKELGELYPAYYDPSLGTWSNTIQYAKLGWTGTDASGKALAEDTVVHVSLTAVPHYYRQADGSFSYEGLGSGSTMTTAITIDNTAPEALDIDVSRSGDGILTVKARDNQYVAAVALLNATGSKFLAVESPNQTEKGKTVTVDLDISQAMGKRFLVAVYDYAHNVRVYEIQLELEGPERSYFTAVNYNTNTYVSMDMQAGMTEIADLDIPTMARAAEFAEGYVFTITEDNMLCVANDQDLSVTRRIAELDAENLYTIDSFADMAYNRVDKQMYALFYSESNDSMVPYLCTIDLTDGTLNVLGEMPADVHTLAIDDEGTCWSAAYDSPSLYKYTIAEAMAGNVTYVGEMGYYGTGSACCMAWDHKEDKLYFCFPNTLLRINTETAEPTLLGYFNYQCVGLYISEEVENSPFDPVDTVDRVELNLTDTRVMVNRTLPLEATVWPWNASDRSVTWTTSDASVATVDANGVITARGMGECVITATSNLDKSKTASCTVSTFKLDKTLNALIWDYEGRVWMSEFNTADLPNYTKLCASELEEPLAAATMGQDGNIYAASLSVNDLKSDLYKLDPVTFEPTKIGPSTDGYVDLAPAPGQPGNSLMAVYGANVLNVDATTGDYYNWYYMFQNDLVALAYVGTHEYKEYGYDTMIDWYFIIDKAGYVYLLGFLEQDGAYYYLEHDRLAPGGIYTVLDFQMETPYFGSAYFDGEMLFFSAYKESRDNVTLMAIDVASGSKACYELGTFETGVWPVAGLMELGELGGDVGIIGTNAKPVAIEDQPALKAIREEKAEGALNYNAAMPLSAGEIKEDQVRVSVTVPTDAVTNGTFWVEFDPAALELKAVQGRTQAFAWKLEEPGKVAIAFAEGAALTADSVIANLDFRAIGNGNTELWVIWGEYGQEYLELAEQITVKLPDNNPFTDVEEDDFFYAPVLWAVEKGVTTGATETTFNPNGKCQRAAVVTFLWRAAGSPEPTITENPFTDVREKDFFYKAVLWAVEKNITTGTSATEFSPMKECNRAQVVTFLWRAMGEPEVANVNNPFQDVKADAWYGPAVLWAVENGITNGMSANEFGVNTTCNRAQVVTFLYRTLA